MAALALFVIASALPDLTFLWDGRGASFGPQGPLGFAADYDGAIKAVDQDSPAWTAGIRPGDRVDFKATSFDDRAYVAGAPARIPAGAAVTVWVVRADRARAVTLVAPASPYPLVSNVNHLSRALAALIFVVVGGLLVLLRPGATTWGLFFYCLGFSPGIGLGGFSRFPSPQSHATYLLIADTLTAAGTAGILLFALRFLCEHPQRWRRTLERTLPYIFVAFVFLIAYPDLANLLLGRAAETEQRVMLALQGVVFATSIAAALQTFLHGRQDERARIQWVVVGLCVGILGTYVGSVLLFSSLLPLNPPRWLQSALLTLNVCLPIAVAYAVIRHRVLDVSFVVSRALVYGAMTFLVLAIFAAIDWLIGRELEAARMAAIVSIAVAIGLSFWLRDLEQRIESVVSTVFFRKRRQAMLRLERATQAVYHAARIPTVIEYLVREPIEALGLVSAALFLPQASGSFHQVLARGWDDAKCEVIEHDDPLALELTAEGQPIHVAEIGWNHADLPAPGHNPILAVPMVARNELLGIALYGAHDNAADIDPEEVRGIRHLARAAQASYDHLRALELAEQVAALKAEIASLRAASGELAR